jgi:hypothetical protein
MIAIVTPAPVRPSSLCAISAPVSPTAFFKSTFAPPLPSDLKSGSEMVCTGYMAFTPGIDPSAASCDGATETEMPFQSESYE